ncbi:MAG: prolyl oligopeptidase family serine peptidase [Chitinophagaceae bacterium]
MKSSIFILCMALAYTSFSQTLTVEKIMRDTKWIGTSPSNAFWSVDNQTIYFNWNPDNQSSDSMYYTDLKSMKPIKADQRKARMAEAMARGNWSTDFTKLLFTYQGDIFLYNINTKDTLRITQTEDFEYNPLFIKNTMAIVYQKGNNLFCWDFKNGATKQLTNFIEGSKSADKKLNEQEEWLKKQQLETSSVIKERQDKHDARMAANNSMKDADTLFDNYLNGKDISYLELSPNANFLAYLLYEAPGNAKQTIVPNYVTASGFTTDIHGRTNVGAPQGSYSFYVLNILQNKLLEIKTDSIPGILDQPDYVKDYPTVYADKKPQPREVVVDMCSWNKDGSRAVVDIRSFDNKDRWLMELDPATGKLTLISRQRDEAWIDGPGIGGSFDNGSTGWINNNNFYFESETTGYAQLYVYDFLAKKINAVTSGNYEVQEVVLSRDKNNFYLLTNEGNPGIQNWYKINTNGSGKVKITDQKGGYEIAMSPDEKYIAYRYSYQNKPWELYVQENKANAKAQQLTHKAMSEEFLNYPWRDAEIFTFAARDGQQVSARIYQPKAGTKNGAAVIFVHGAGYLQNVDYWWSYYVHEFMFNNLLADKGYTVLDIDYRGSAGYGRDWRTGIYRYMGGKDLTDEVDAADMLVKKYGIDANRIGMYGGSYGGFMTLMAMFTAPGKFNAGAALRPVTDWAQYNHGYTSNILNEPFNDSIAYRRSSPIYFANGLQGHLLICHGVVDENVHFQDAVRLSQRLIELGKNNWEIAPYPVEDHGFVEASSWTDEYKRILQLFDENLLKK